MPPFIERTPDYSIRDGIIHIVVEGQELCCMSIRTFKLGMEKAQQEIAEYEHGKIVRLPPRGRPKRDES